MESLTIRVSALEKSNSEILSSIRKLHVFMVRGFEEINKNFALVHQRLDNLEDRMVKLEDRMVKLEGGMVKLEDRMVKLEDRMVKSEGRMVKLEGGMVKVEGGMVKLEGGIVNLEGGIVKLEGGIVNLEDRLDHLLIQIVSRIESLATDLSILRGNSTASMETLDQKINMMQVSISSLDETILETEVRISFRLDSLEGKVDHLIVEVSKINVVTGYEGIFDNTLIITKK